MFERCNNAPKGREGGGDGAKGRVSLGTGKEMRGKGQQSIPPGDRLRLDLAGGGGFGDPFTRDPERVAEDVRNEMISAESARDNYGVAVADDGTVDAAATAELRGTANR